MTEKEAVEEGFIAAHAGRPERRLKEKDSAILHRAWMKGYNLGIEDKGWKDSAKAMKLNITPWR